MRYEVNAVMAEEGGLAEECCNSVGASLLLTAAQLQHNMSSIAAVFHYYVLCFLIAVSFTSFLLCVLLVAARKLTTS